MFFEEYIHKHKLLLTISDALTMAAFHFCFRREAYRIKNRDKPIKIDVAKVLVFMLVTINVVESRKNSENNDTNPVDSDIPKRLKVIEAFTGRSFFDDVYTNGTFRTGNSLWDNLLNKCTVSPSVSCLQKNVYTYLDDSLNFKGDVNVASGVCFKQNNVDINKYSKEANIIYLTGSKEDARAIDEENEINDEEESESPLEEVTDALYNKGVKFLATHDMKLTLPEVFFNGATLRVSPRALTKTGALVHIDLEPREDSNGVARIFLKKIKKHIKKKLITAAIAIILVVKLIALKLVFVLPLILGVTTAKKMFIKLLLFLFPPLSYLFKMCSWYYQSYHTTKYHHHHHLITHHHKNPHGYHHPSSHSSTVVHPHGHGHSGPPHSFEHYPQDWELSGPGLGNEYVASGVSGIHRNAVATFKPDLNDMNEINSWGLGLPPGQSMNVGEYASTNVVPQMVHPPGHKTPIGNVGRPVGPPNPYHRNKKTTPKVHDPLQAEKEALIRAAALAARAPPSPVRDEILRVSAVKLTESNRIKAETELVRQQQEILAAQDPDTIAAEKFYGVLLDKVDQVLSSIGASDPGCRERAVCSLYKDPFKHAPYSNLVSNELSKDASELLPPAESKKALRYYNYVQAAREGQESKDCVTLYPNCNVDYNK